MISSFPRRARRRRILRRISWRSNRTVRNKGETAGKCQGKLNQLSTPGGNRGRSPTLVSWGLSGQVPNVQLEIPSAELVNRRRCVSNIRHLEERFECWDRSFSLKSAHKIAMIIELLML
jgi:hypothetical protein